MNFFQEQREKLGLSTTQMGARLNGTAQTVRQWEADTYVPRPPISVLAAAYEVTESKMEREVMAMRRRIEAREAAVAK